MIPPGEFDDKTDAEPPRIASILATFPSNLVKISAVANAISPNKRTGSPSSCNCKYFEPPEEIGTPRTAMFAFPSPPVDSERIPGIDLKISAVDLGADCSICLIPKVVIETLDLILVFGFTTPVTKTSSRAFVLVESVTTFVSFCENIELANSSAINNPMFFNKVILFII